MTNSVLMSDEQASTPATLPVKLGAPLSVRIPSAVEVVSSAYLVLLHATTTLVEAILPLNLSSSIRSLLGDALPCWSEGHDSNLQMGMMLIGRSPEIS